ncbi:hypothetical protein [Desulfobulbus propionicus]|jgi:hypothetical protein
MKNYLKYDWDAIAGIIAAVAAILMHFLHLVESDVLLMIAVVLIALLFLRDLRRERDSEHVESCLQRTELSLHEILNQLRPSEVELIGPQNIHQAMMDFSLRACNEMTWFHICPLMFKRQSIFDDLLKTAIENPNVHSIQFIIDDNSHEAWDQEMAPKIRQCPGHDKVQEVVWASISGGVSAIVADINKAGKTECLLSFWGEPFMARMPGLNVPRYIFHVHGNSELISRMVEVVRSHRFCELTKGGE